MAYFMYRLNPPRPTFAGDMSDDEAGAMGLHAEYWQRLLDAGRVVVFGPVADPAGLFGMAVVEASDATEVAAMGEADPAVTAGVCTFDVLEMPATSVRG